MKGAPRIRRALLSVWDKSRLVELATRLAERGVELVASGGTAETLEAAGLRVATVESLTGSPEILGGRVKTLHPAVHGAILARRGEPGDEADLERMGIDPIDLVVANLYPFADAEELGAEEPEARTELIDIGGVALIRAAAKNWRHVAVAVEPDDYDALAVEIEREGGVSEGTRRRLAAKAFRLTAWYDARIASWVGGGEGGWPERWTVGGELVAGLRYGENPHQAAALYRDRAPRPGDLTAVSVLQGKPLSYNNYVDVEAARRLVRDLASLDPDSAHCVIVKHTIPCGAASAGTPLDAYLRALAADPVSAFGGIVARDRPGEPELGQRLTEHFLEVVSAPRFAPGAREALARKRNLRLLEGTVPEAVAADLEVRRVAGGLLVQQPNLVWLPDGTPAESFEVPTEAKPTADQWPDLMFAWTVCRAVASNAIVLAKEGATVGIGSGQTNRVGAVEIAVSGAREHGHDPAGAALASDGFFPFADNVEAAVEAGIGAIVQPGGSRRDEEVVAAADRAGLPMVFTGVRQFRH